MKRFLFLAVFLSSAFTLQGCDDPTLAAGAGFVTGVIVGNQYDNDHRHCRGGYVTRCSGYRDRWGRYGRDCRQVYDRCSGRYLASMSFADANEAGVPSLWSEDQATVSTEAGIVAEKYSIGFEGAQKIVDALAEARDAKWDGILALGFSKEDLLALYKNESASPACLEALSVNLNLAPDSTEAFVTRVQQELKVAREMSN